MKLHILFVLFSLTLFNSCADSKLNEEERFITSKLSELDLGNDVQWLVILPNVGCPGCIQQGEAFLRDNLENPKIYFVITELQSVKILQQKVGKKLVGLPNLLIDLDREFSIPGENQIYPCIVQLKNGRMTGYQFQSPNNGLAFDQLYTETESESNAI